MMQAFYAPRGAEQPEHLEDPEAILALYRQRDGLLWIDLEGPTAKELDRLEAEFGLHPVAVQICREVTSQPIVHDYDAYLFLVLHAVDFRETDEDVGTLEVDIFWSRDFVVTVHRDEVRSIGRLRELCGAGPAPVMERGADFFVHDLVDRIIDNFAPTLERIAGVVEECEEAIFGRPSDITLRRLLDLRRSTAYLLRVATGQRDVVGRIVRREFPAITDEALAYWRDAYDHLVRMVQAVESQRDLIAATRDAYLTVISNRMNEIMKVLTIIATIFIPVTFIAGIYGMNFDWMPETEVKWGYPAALAAMAAVAGGMLIYFRRKRWI